VLGVVTEDRQQDFRHQANIQSVSGCQAAETAAKGLDARDRNVYFLDNDTGSGKSSKNLLKNPSV
jgi:hypothetical protein